MNTPIANALLSYVTVIALTNALTAYTNTTALTTPLVNELPTSHEAGRIGNSNLAFGAFGFLWMEFWGGVSNLDGPYCFFRSGFFEIFWDLSAIGGFGS